MFGAELVVSFDTIIVVEVLSGSSDGKDAEDEKSDKQNVHIGSVMIIW